MTTRTIDSSAGRDTRGVSRRDFLVRTGSGLVLGFVLQNVSRVDLAEAGVPPPPAATGATVNSWLEIGADNSVTLTIGSSEMGQGSFSGLAQILSEDLMVDYARIRAVQGGPTLASPAPVGSAINTVGSSVIRRNFWRMRDAGAAAREMLVQAAMNRIGDQDRARYSVRDGVITHAPTGRSLTYGEVAADAAALPPPASAPLVPDDEFAVIGRSVPRLDIPAKVDGSAKYGIDIRLPNMVYAVIRHAPSVGGTLARTPSRPSGTIAVVPTQVVAGTERGGEAVGNVNAVAVVGTNTWDTWQAAKRLKVSWRLPANASALNSDRFLADGLALSSGGTPFVPGGANPPGTVYTVEGEAGSTTAAIDGSPSIVESVYSLPYVAHACMEVLNCTVDYVAGVRCDVYAPTQSATSALGLVVSLTGLSPDQVTVHTTYLGGGLGRKAETDFVSQAVQVGMAVGRPVKLMWPREEDFTHDQYRPMAVIRARAGLAQDGNVTGFSYRNVSPSILGQRGRVLGALGDSQGIEGATHLPYAFGTRAIEYVAHPSPVPVGFWRSVGASLNTFGVESMIDELAEAASQDPYLFRRGLLTDPRWMQVLDAVADRSGWLSPPRAGRARGIAIGTAFGSIVAQVVEASNLTTTSVRINKVWIAIDCYLAVNPDSIEAQLVGGMVHGLNATLYGRQTFVNGAAQVKNFNSSRMIRLNEMPDVDVTILPNPSVADRTAAIGGAGELGVPTFAPALAAACYKLGGRRIRTLPLFPAARMGGL
ncbi:MAG: xanthine dehydrogenase family protein molybdopterin-binding subunit [Acidobacteria bacterium]|nr:xanthine dehydrogenase family protein molybdopterin-binding subunit [Acidobacteriota bacterium]